MKQQRGEKQDAWKHKMKEIAPRNEEKIKATTTKAEREEGEQAGGSGK